MAKEFRKGQSRKEREDTKIGMKSKVGKGVEKEGKTGRMGKEAWKGSDKIRK